MPLSSFVSDQAPWLLPYLEHTAFSLPFLFLISFATMGWIIVSGRRRAKVSKRSSYDKGAKQLTLLASCVGWLLVVACKGLLFYTTGSWFPEDLTTFLLEILWIMLFLTVFCLNLHYALWKILSSHPVLHSLLGGVTKLQGLATALIAFGLGRLLMKAFTLPELSQLTSPSALETLARAFLPDHWAPPYTALCCFFPLIFVMPYIFGSLGFLFLRKRQDFGRDHYTIVLSWSARCARNLGLCLLLVLAGSLGYQIAIFLPHLEGDLLPFFFRLLPELLLFVIWLFSVLTTHIVAKSEIPMRHSLLLVTSNMLVVLSVFLLTECWLS